MLPFCARTIPIDWDNVELAFLKYRRKTPFRQFGNSEFGLLHRVFLVLIVMKTPKDERYVITKSLFASLVTYFCGYIACPWHPCITDSTMTSEHTMVQSSG